MLAEDGVRQGEWRCRCGIRAASCGRCLRCGAERPGEIHQPAVARDEVESALAVFWRWEGSEGPVGAMARVLEFDRQREAGKGGR